MVKPLEKPKKLNKPKDPTQNPSKTIENDQKNTKKISAAMGEQGSASEPHIPLLSWKFNILLAIYEAGDQNQQSPR